MEMTWVEERMVNRRGKAERNARKIEEILQRLRLAAVQDVLELGCGTGAVSARLAGSHGWNVWGTDYDPEQIRLAQEQHREIPGLRFENEDASRLRFADGSFDLVVSQSAGLALRGDRGPAGAPSRRNPALVRPDVSALACQCPTPAGKKLWAVHGR